MANAKPIHEIFVGRARAIGHMMRKYAAQLEGFEAFSNNESLNVQLIDGDESSGPTLRYTRRRSYGGKRRHAVIEFGNIQPLDPRNVLFGPETVLKSEMIGSTEQTVDNRGGYAEVEVNLGDLFGKESASEQSTDKSAGTSVSVSVTASQSIEGFAEFEESVTAEAHAEISESSSSSESSSREDSGSENTSVPIGKCVVIRETRARADTSQEVTAEGVFGHTVRIGQYTERVKPEHKWSMTQWDSMSMFRDCVNGDAPDNWPWAERFKADPPWSADAKWALREISSPLRYQVKFEGKIKRSYSVTPCGDSSAKSFRQPGVYAAEEDHDAEVPEVTSAFRTDNTD